MDTSETSTTEYTKDLITRYTVLIQTFLGICVGGLIYLVIFADGHRIPAIITLVSLVAFYSTVARLSIIMKRATTLLINDNPPKIEDTNA